MLNAEMKKLYAEKKARATAFRRVTTCLEKGDYERAAIAAMTGGIFSEITKKETEVVNLEDVTVSKGEILQANPTDEGAQMEYNDAKITSDAAIKARDDVAAKIGTAFTRVKHYSKELAAARAEKDARKRDQLLKEFRKANH